MSALRRDGLGTMHRSRDSAPRARMLTRPTPAMTIAHDGPMDKRVRVAWPGSVLRPGFSGPTGTDRRGGSTGPMRRWVPRQTHEKRCRLAVCRAAASGRTGAASSWCAGQLRSPSSRAGWRVSSMVARAHPQPPTLQINRRTPLLFLVGARRPVSAPPPLVYYRCRVRRTARVGAPFPFFVGLPTVQRVGHRFQNYIGR